MLKNLDTGEFVSLKKVEEELKKHALDPVTLNILHRTFSEENNRKIDTESDDTAEESGGNKVIGLAKKYSFLSFFFFLYFSNFLLQ